MVLAKGGRRDRKIDSLHGKDELGRGQEGVVLDVDLMLRGRVRSMVQKKFPLVHDAQLDPEARRDFPVAENQVPAYRNPRQQHRIAERLMEANRRNQLGLRLPTTIRLVETPGENPSLLLTKVNIEKAGLTAAESREFEADIVRQTGAADSAGFSLSHDCFKPVRNRDTGGMQAFILDFGLIQEKKGAANSPPQ